MTLNVTKLTKSTTNVLCYATSTAERRRASSSIEPQTPNPELYTLNQYLRAQDPQPWTL